MRFTVKTAAALELPAGKDDFIAFDSIQPGLGLRIRSTGSRTWIFQYQVGPRQRRLTLGLAGALAPEKARALAAGLAAKVRLGGDPAAEKALARAKAGETFKACLDLYLKTRRGTVRASTYGEIERHLVRNLAPLHNIPVTAVDRRAVALQLARITVENGPVQANRTRNSVRKFFNWCAGEGFVDANAATHTNANPERSRDRTLNDEELRLVWHALPDNDFGTILKLLVLTGCRREEIAQLKWDEVDLARGYINLGPQRTKNHRAHVVPLSDMARAILEVRSRNGRDYVFGRAQGGFSGWSFCKRQLDEQTKLAPWVIHDLRRSAATGMATIGIQPHVIECVLNHVSGFRAGVSGVYNRATYIAEMTTALARWAEHVACVVEGRVDNVTPLRA
jgi:integrase